MQSIMKFSFTVIILLISVCSAAYGDSLFLKNADKSIDIEIVGFEGNYVTAELSESDLKSLIMQFPDDTYSSGHVSLKVDDITIPCKVDAYANNKLILSIPADTISSLHMAFNNSHSKNAHGFTENEYGVYAPDDDEDIDVIKTRRHIKSANTKIHMQNKLRTSTSQTLSDELITVDGIYIKGKLIKITDNSITFLQDGENICTIRLENVSVFSSNNEIIKVYYHENKPTQFSILKPVNGEYVSIKKINVYAFKLLDATHTLDEIITAQKEPSSYLIPKQAIPSDTHTSEKEGDTAPPIAGDKDKTVTLAAEEAKKDASPQKTWKGSVESGINIKTGNTEATTTHLKIGYSNERKCDKIFFDMLAIFETKKNQSTGGSEETANEQKVTLKYEYNTSFKVYLFLQEYFEHDELENLNYRTISSFGPGYRLFSSEKIKYRIEGGPAFTHERYHGGITENNFGLRFGHYLDWQMLSSTKLFAKNEYNTSVEDQEDWRLDSSLGIKHDLMKALSLSTVLINQYDNTPSGANKKDDTTLIGSIGYNF